MKKLLVLILALVSVFSFAMFSACGGENENGKTDPDSSVVITLSDTDVYLELGEEGKINYTVSGTTNTATKWSTSDDKVCSVDSGKLVGLKEGKATISLTIDGETVTASVTVFSYQLETADTYVTPVEVYDYYYEGEIIAHDFTLTFADYGMVYNKNAKAVFVKGDKEIEAVVRPSSDKSKLFISLSALGAINYGAGYSLVVSSADKKIEIPLQTIVTKFINDKDDLHYLMFFGGLQVASQYCTYDGYFVQTTDIDMECIPLLNRRSKSGEENFRDDPTFIDKDNPDITGRLPIDGVASGTLYGFFNVDVGFCGIYDGQGYSIVNVSLYDDNDGLPKSIGNHGGIFGNVGRKAVVKNLGVTATDTWTWYSYGSTYVFGNSVNGTLENIYVKITPTLYVPNEENPCPTTNNLLSRAVSGATLKNVVLELDISTEGEDAMCRPYNAGDLVNSRGKANYITKEARAFQFYGADAAYSYNYTKNSPDGAGKMLVKDTNTYEECYFIYTDYNDLEPLYSMSGFRCFTSNAIPNEDFAIFQASEYWEVNSNGAPVFKGLGV